ncbi:MAG: hypothetical protein Q4G28_05970 [Neisseria sp.]|nr:hypothetical protein [Neisseria sp.]
MAFNLSIIFFGSFLFLVFFGKFFDLEEEFEQKRGVSIRWLFAILAAAFTGVIYLIYS